jgi:hypothetical protein
MIVGKDFPSFFDKDNFTQRRTTGHNMHDPESFITGAEIAKGFTYTNSRRNWDSFSTYVKAVAGDYSPEQIEQIAPRVPINLLTNTDAFKVAHSQTFPVSCTHGEGFDRYCGPCLDRWLESEMQ